MEYYVNVNREVSGPHALDRLKEMIASGVLSDSTYVLPVNSEKWLFAREVQELFPIVPSLPSLPPVPPPSLRFDLNRIRHPHEMATFYVSATISAVLWLFILITSWGMVLLLLPVIAFCGWVSGLYFKAMFYGNAMRITERQHPEIYKLVTEAADTLGMNEVPAVFIYNSGGLMNAIAVRFTGKQNIVLFSALVDNMLLRKAHVELKSIIAHELGHHVAGHTSPWKSLLLLPINVIPFLSNFYSRCCEYTCDRISYAVTGDKTKVQRALVTLAHGAQSLSEGANLTEFCAQESQIPSLIGFYLEILSSHPRITRRICALESFAEEYR